MTGYVYMTASKKRGTIHTGVTSDLGRRMPEDWLELFRGIGW